MKNAGRVLFLLVAVAMLFACADSRFGDFFGGLFGAAAPVADAVGQPWLGSILAWAGDALSAHPYETAGASLVAATGVNHWINGTPGTVRRKAIREGRATTKATMRKLDALEREKRARQQSERAHAAHQRATAKHNAALLAAQQHAELPKAPPA